MRYILAAILLTLASVSHAVSFTCTWTTERTDGTALPRHQIATIRLYEVDSSGKIIRKINEWKTCKGIFNAKTGTAYYALTLVTTTKEESALTSPAKIVTSHVVSY